MAKVKTKKPIAAILTDTHLDEKNVETNRLIFQQAREIALSLGLEELYHGGDFFHSRKAQTQNNLNALLDIIEQTQKGGLIELRGIPGNHDKTNYGSQDSFLDTYRKEFTLVRTHDCFTLNGTTLLHLVPFFDDINYLAVMNTVVLPVVRRNSKHKHVLLTHIGLDGAVMNNGIAVKSSITKDLFSAFDKVMIGHYHDANDWYIGSSIQHNFGERPDKGLTILYDDLTTETIPLDYPKYLAYEIDVKDLGAKELKELKEEKEKGKDHIRVVLTGSEDKVKAFDKQRLMEIGIDVKTKQDDIKVEELEDRVEAFDSKSLLEAFSVFCEKNQLDHTTGLKYLEGVI